MSVKNISRSFAAGTLSPVEFTRSVLERAEMVNQSLNAFVFLDPERAIEEAKASESRWRRQCPIGPLDGIPTTIKDLIPVRGWPTRRGSLTSPVTPENEDAPPVARLREAGCVFIGKTTTSEFGWKGVTDSPQSGVARHPFLSNLTPGGSSGGAGVAAALDLGLVHLGTDGGGSIRIPAAFCGVFGFKPTFGRVPVYPRPPAGTLWHQGPLSRTVADSILVLRTIAVPDPRDPLAAPALAIPEISESAPDLSGLRIGYSETLGYARPDPAVTMVVTSALERFEALGARVEPLNVVLDDPIDVMRPLWSVAIATSLSTMDDSQRDVVDSPLRTIAEEGRNLDAVTLRKLEARREDISRKLLELHHDHDLLITPQVAIPPFDAGREYPVDSRYKRWWEWSPYTYPYNLSGQPCATIPCGFTSTGLPVACQLVGKRFDDVQLLRVALAYERASENGTIALDFSVDVKT